MYINSLAFGIATGGRAAGTGEHRCAAIHYYPHNTNGFGFMACASRPLRLHHPRHH